MPFSLILANYFLILFLVFWFAMQRFKCFLYSGCTLIIKTDLFIFIVKKKAPGYSKYFFFFLHFFLVYFIF